VGVTIRKKDGKWFVFVNHNGQRKAKCIGENRAAAAQVKRVLEAKLALGDIGVFGEAGPKMPTFGDHADLWLKDHATLVCKPSTIDGYESVLRQHLRPRFASTCLNEIKRNEIKSFIGDLVAKGLTRSTVRNALSILRGIFNHAIEDGLFESNPAANLGRFTRTAKSSEVKGVALTPEEVEKFLSTAKRVSPADYPVLLLAARAGLRRGELVALQWGDIEFGLNEQDEKRFILVQHNFVRRQHTTTKSKRSRRVDMSRQLRSVLIKMRETRMKAAVKEGKTDISKELVFSSSGGKILDPDNFYHRHFVPLLLKSGIRKIRLHDLRHTFGSLLIQRGASLAYVRDQLGHASIQITVDVYGHLVAGADIAWVDRLDPKRNRQRKATEAQPRRGGSSEISA
jgi:integrase